MMTDTRQPLVDAYSLILAAIDDGRASLGSSPGLGIEPDLQALAEVGDEFNDPNQLGDEPGMELARALAMAMFKMFGLEVMPDMLAVDVFPSLGSINSPHYIAGFVRSALNVWTEVEEQVLA